MLNRLKRLLTRKNIARHTDLGAADSGSRLGKSGNRELIAQVLEGCGDVEYRLLSHERGEWWLIYVSNLIDTSRIEKSVVEPAMQALADGSPLDQALTAVNFSTSSSVQKIADQILRGTAALIGDRTPEALLIPAPERPSRSISTPQVERVIAGPHEAFTESVATNRALIRYYLPTPRLKMESFTVGELTRSQVSIFYVQDMCPREQIDEVRKRLESMTVAAVVDNQVIEEAFTSHSFALFPEVIQTERPDRTIAFLSQGRIAIAVEGSHSILVVPTNIRDFITSPEDYYLLPPVTAMARLVRLLGVLASTTFTATYVAVVSFHYEVVPFSLLIPLTQSVIQLPFTPVMEALVLESAADILREASARLPGELGPIIGVVGALIIGQAAIQAKLVSPILVIITALSMVGGYMVPDYSFSMSLRVLRYPMILLASVL